MIVVWLFFTVPWVCLQFMILVFREHTHLLFLQENILVIVLNWSFFLIRVCLYWCLHICACLYLYLYILQQREYMTAEEAKTIMYDKETWNQYKTVLLQRTVGGLHRNQNEKVL